MGLTGWLRRRPTRREISFALALILPPIAAFLTADISGLQRVPFALFMLSTILIAAFGGMRQALAAAGFAILISLIVPLPSQPRSMQYVEKYLPRDLVLLAAAALVGVISDSRRRVEEELKAALDELQERSDDLVASLDSSKCACWTIDLDSGRSARWYSGSYQVFGRPFRELEELPTLRPLLHPDDQPRLTDLVTRMRTATDPIVFEHRVPWPDGELHWLEMRANRVTGPGCRWRGVTVDITERKLTEAALLRSEKLAAMGRLASTVAHEINNPLEAVTNLLYLARIDGSESGDRRDYLAAAEHELARLSNITRLTLGFVRSSGDSADTDLAEVVDEVLHLFHHRLENKNVHIEREYEPGVAVRIAPHELRQIATNLVANAADAVGLSDGRISIRIQRADGHGTMRGVLQVEDNGSGIEAAHLQRIFEPFFSTKEEFGTGIGLWVTKELVEKNGGRIDVASEKLAVNGSSNAPTSATADVRTRFRIELPLVS
jgi:PAS domain S-box-containing protein